MGALAIVASGVAAPRAVHAQAAVSTEAQAQLRFARGRELFLARSYEQALAEFRAANALVASPNTRLYIARCLRELGRFAEAYVEFLRAAGEASDRATSEPRYAATRDTARTEASALTSRFGRLTVRVPHPPEGVSVTVGGAAVPSAGWDVPTPVDPGTVEIVATAPGRQAFRERVEVRAGQDVETTIELPIDPNATVPVATPAPAPLPAPEGRAPAPSVPVPPRTERVVTGGGVRVAGFFVAGVGVAGAVGFGIFGTLAQNRYDDLRSYCGGPCDPSLASQIDEGERYALLANVSLGVGIAGLVAGAVMIAVGGPTEQERPVATRTQPALWGAPLAGQGGVVGVRGAF
jgi:hypothetical protein